jgi:hypothetical protein
LSKTVGYTIDDFGVGDIGKLKLPKISPKALIAVNPMIALAAKVAKKKAASKPTPAQKEAATNAFKKVLAPLAKTTAGKVVHAAIKSKVAAKGIPVNQKGNAAVQQAINARLDANIAAQEAKAKVEAAKMMEHADPGSVQALEAKAEAELAVEEGKAKEAEAIKSAEMAVDEAQSAEETPQEVIPTTPETEELTYDQKQTMAQILPGFAPMSTITAKWNALSKNQKIALVGGGIAAAGVVIYLVYRATRPSEVAK